MLTFLIECYWRLVPAETRRSCIFGETCSRYVYRQASERGLAVAIRALLRRLRTCRPGYEIVEVEDAVRVRAADGTVLTPEALNPMLKAFCSRYAEVELELNGRSSGHTTAATA